MTVHTKALQSTCYSTSASDTSSPTKYKPATRANKHLDSVCTVVFAFYFIARHKSQYIITHTCKAKLLVCCSSKKKERENDYKSIAVLKEKSLERTKFQGNFS